FLAGHIAPRGEKRQLGVADEFAVAVLVAAGPALASVEFAVDRSEHDVTQPFRLLYELRVADVAPVEPRGMKGLRGDERIVRIVPRHGPGPAAREGDVCQTRSSRRELALHGEIGQMPRVVGRDCAGSYQRGETGKDRTTRASQATRRNAGSRILAIRP